VITEDPAVSNEPGHNGQNGRMHADPTAEAVAAAALAGVLAWAVRRGVLAVIPVLGLSVLCLWAALRA
jgi:hypothetical protein